MRGKSFKKIISTILIFFIAFGIFIAGIVVFIKFNTPLAAEITDKYLRPIFGNDFIVNLEKVFYNASDKLAQLTYKPGQVFEFLPDGDTTNIQGGDLNLTPIQEHFFSLQTGEGIWNNFRLSIFPKDQVIAYTFVRPDSLRPFAYVTLIQMDMKKLRIGAVAGIQQPAGVIGIPGPGKIPSQIVTGNNLVAAFNGGFQYKDGAYGMIVRDVTYLPLKNDLATLVAFSNGKLNLFKYEGQISKGQIDFVRQNCPMLIENGQIATYNDVNRKLWGRTPTTSIYTWRSGLGITKSGNLIYAIGNNLIPDTLAKALEMAGVVNAMQLDINPYWVRFNVFDSKGNGAYQTSILMKGVYDGSKAFLNGYQKDFFYIYKKTDFSSF